MFQTFDIRHWFLVAVLVLINVTVFGCLLLMLAGRVVPSF
jgi:hypothetical protein